MSGAVIRVALSGGLIVEHPALNHRWTIHQSGVPSVERTNDYHALLEIVASYGAREWIRVDRAKGVAKDEETP